MRFRDVVVDRTIPAAAVYICRDIEIKVGMLRMIHSDKRGLSLTVSLITGFILALVALGVYLGVYRLSVRFSPTQSNAERYLRQGKLDEALVLAQQMTNDTYRVSLLKGRVFLAQGIGLRREDAWHTYGTNPHDWLTGVPIDSALWWFKRALSQEPQAALVHYYLGIVYKEKGWFEVAAGELQQALARDTKSVDTHLALASLAAATHQPEDAIATLRDAYRMAPHNADVAKNMAVLYRFYIQEPESAMVWLNRYLNIADRRDIATNMAMNEMRDLLERYPEFAPKTVQPWQQQRSFKARN